ncbi:UNVERIFIED_CONTAM: putative protein phosphatase 2C 58 [Sesamum calycinum]|uniref:protein-serine/threonine phosphatase n=1 Tax=Sesamum calycinum TaxID=2727403 RepID=A0AAW2NI24_9LAMI
MGVYLSTPKTEKASEDGENDKLRYGLSSMQGWRATMEDAHAAFTNLDGLTSFFGVYDGHGGKEVSRFCAKFLHHQVLQHEAYAAGDLGTSVRKAFLRMDEMMCGKTGQKELALLKAAADHSSSNGQNLPQSDDQNGQTNHWPSEEGIHSGYKGPSSGTTACVAIIRNNQLLVANAGDSRCVICRKGKAHDLSKDHKPELAAEKKRILEAGGYIQYGRVNGSLNLARAIDTYRLKVLYLFFMFSFARDCMSSQQAVDFVKEQLRTEKKLSAVCERVLDRCLAPSSGQEGCDNMTMILVQFKKSVDQKPSSKQQPGPSAK